MAASIREIDDASVWLAEWDAYENGLKALRENEYMKLLSTRDGYAAAQAKLKKSVDAQKKNLTAFVTSYKRIGRSEKSGENNGKLSEMTTKLNDISSTFNVFDEALPKTAGWFLRACIGEINVSLFQDKRHYKDVYEKFKVKTMVAAMLLSLINIFFINTRFLDAIFNGILVWYYSSLTLQEQILRANGSRIKGWYVTHHYLSIMVSGFLLIWPASVTYQLFRTQFYCFVLYLSFVQCLQYYYQSGIMYRMHALGHGKDTDTTQDGMRGWMVNRLKFLVPFLVVGYLFQLYNAFTLYEISKHRQCREWQVMASAILFVVIGIGNTLTLIIVLRQKISGSMGHIRFPCS